MFNKLKNRIYEYLKPLQDYDYSPKKRGDLKAVCFESKNPLGNKLYETSIFNCTEWVNGEGYDISINTYNESSKKSKDRFISISEDDVQGVLFCLKELGYFD